MDDNQVITENLVSAKYAQRLKKTLSIAGSIIATLIILIVLLYFFALNNPSNEKIQQICTTQACIKAADPCEDFFEFSCGNFLHKTRLEDNQIGLNTFQTIDKQLGESLSDLLTIPESYQDIQSVKNVKKLMQSCLNENHIENYGVANIMKFIISEFNGWPLFDPVFIKKDRQDIYKILVSLFKNGITPIFNLYVTTSLSNPDVPIIQISQASWFFDKHYYENENIMSWYRNHIAKVLRSFNSNNDDLSSDIYEMVKIEKKLAKNLLTIEEKRHINYEKLTLEQLIKTYPEFDWIDFLKNGVFKNLANVTIFNNETIYVTDTRYIKNSLKIFYNELKMNKKNLHNLFIWVFVYLSQDFLPKKFKMVSYKYSKNYKSYKNYSTTRLNQCIGSVSDLMEFAVGRLYVENFFNHQSKTAAFQMINNIQKEFKIMLKEYEWMDNISRKAAIEKVDTLDLKVGYPDFIFNNTYIEEMYKEYLMSNVDFFGNNILINQILVRKNLQELRKNVDRKIWQMGPAVVNAYYSAQSNQICFPAGILQAPFYDSSLPNYLNYGGIGAVIGHEITHGFDDKGRNFDKNGVYHEDGSEDLWTNRTIENYKGRAKCIVDQYNNFLIKQINKRMNGNQTQGENIADNGGLKESFRAYKRWETINGKEPLLPGLKFNQHQLFFINFGQIWCSKYKDSYLEKTILKNVHSIGEFRVKGTTMNLKDFSSTFNCKPGQRNNPVKKCSLW